MKILQFLRILDQTNQVSITNLSVMSALVAAISAPNPYTIAVFIATIASYQWKRYHESRGITDSDKDRIAKLENEISNIRAAMALKR